MGVELLDWLRRILPFERGIAPAQTLKRTLARLDPRQLEMAFADWVKSLAGRNRGVIAIDGKTVRGSKSGRNHGRTRTGPARCILFRPGPTRRAQVNDS